MTKRLDENIGVDGVLQRQMRYAKILLQELRGGPLRWGEMEKRFFERSGSHHLFTFLMNWLLKNGYIMKEGPSKSRKHYRINYDKVLFDDDGAIIIKFS